MVTQELPRTTGADLRRVMSHWATGVSVITAREPDGRLIGLVCNSFSSISLEPPLVSWAVDLGSSSIEAWRRVEAYSVHILSASDGHYVERFARRGAAKFDGVTTRPTTVGTPALTDIEVRLDCAVVARHEAGDHLILLGQVLDHHTVERFEPLTNHSLKRR